MKGIRRHGLGWQAAVYVAGAGREFQAFPLETPEQEMQAWRDATRNRLELLRSETDGPIAAGTFAADAKRYLRAVRALKDHKGRTRDINVWVATFGDRRTSTLKSHEIRACRDAWLTVGPKRVRNRQTGEWEDKPIPLAASTVNHRLRALENFYTVMCPQRYNPVRDVPEVKEPDAADRALPYDVIDLVLATMPDRGQGVKGQRRSTVSKSKARLRLMAYTGLTPKQMMALEPADLAPDVPAIRLASRDKGKGAAGGWKPLPPDATEALCSFVAASAFGTFSKDALRQSWQRACAKLDLPRLNPYDLRHSYATELLERTGDMKATQHLLSHADERTTQRYAQRAVPSWLKAAVAKVGALRQQIAPKYEVS